MTTVNDRIRSLINASDCRSVYSFSKLVGIHHKTIKSYIEGTTEPKPTLLNMICKVFIDLNPEWLRSGKGEQWTEIHNPIRIVPASVGSNKSAIKVETIGRDVKKVEASIIEPETLASADKSSYSKMSPYYDVDFSCGFLDVYNDKSVVPEMFISSPVNRSGSTVWCNATGQSMEPTICSGDMVALEPITHIDQLMFGEIYAIAFEGQRCIKRICAGNTKETWILKSDNQCGLYSPQEINISNVISVFRVVACMHKF